MGLSLSVIDNVSSLRNDTSRTEYSRVTGRLDEVQTGVNAVVNDFLPVDAVLLLEIRVETRLNVLHDGLPATDAVSQRSTRDEN